MKLMVVSLLALSALALSKPAEQRDPSAWWKTGTFYQIYPRSFKDSNGDGVGDLQGVISKLDHLKNAGVTATWLSPIFKSPQVDAGYDISDYKAIQEEYGTMEDFEELVAKAEALGIKIIMDLVPNHSSDQHEWFKKSERREEGFEDFYVWVDGKNNDNSTPPNNWISNFKYSAWQWSDVRKQFYYHEFAVQQPDLNYRNPNVVAEIKDVMRFWMDKGVHGFRVDAVPFLFETGLADEPLSGNPTAGPDDWNYLEHIYTNDQPETYDMVYQFREFVDKYNAEHPHQDERILMTEAYANLNNTMLYYGDGERLGAHFTFNFQLIPVNHYSAQQWVDLIKEWMQYMPKQYTPNWVVGNHDNHRIATRMGVENIDGINMLIAMLPGVAVTYNGEEIGMEDGYVSWSQGNDPGACNGPPENFNKSSRDFERTPFHWDDTDNAGFSTNDSTWLPVSDKYLTNNLKQQMEQEGSHFKIYQSMIELRKDPILQNGEMRIEVVEDTVISLERYTDSSEMVLLFNVGSTRKNVNLKNVFKRMGDTWEVKVSSTNRKGLLRTNNLVLQPHESLIVA